MPRSIKGYVGIRETICFIKSPGGRFIQYGEQHLRNNEKLQAAMTCVT
jgi:hypothetical protein